MTRKEKEKTYSTEELYEELISFLDEIKNEQTIVEGTKDKRVLVSFGFSNVHTINKSFYETAESFKGNLLILTDFDPEGEEIAKKLSLLLVKFGCNVDVSSRKKLRSLFIKNKINTVEALQKLSPQKI